MRLAQSIGYWWQEPRKASEVEEDRTVSTLELFFDIVFSIYLARITQWEALTAVTIEHFLTFILIFSQGWWIWFNSCVYHDFHGRQDVRTRVMTFIQMIGMGSASIFAADPLRANVMGFGLSYGALLIFFAFLWHSTGRYDSEHEPYATPYSRICLLLGALFIGSIFIAEKYRLIVWFLVGFLQINIHFFVYRSNKRHGVDIIRKFGVTKALQARFGRLPLIILGQIIGQLLAGVYSVQLVLPVNFQKAFLGLFISIGIWWIYYDFVPIERPKERLRSTAVWITGQWIIAFVLCVLGVQIIRTIQLTSFQAVVAFVLQHYSLLLAVFEIGCFVVIGTLREVKIHQRAKHYGRDTLLISAFALVSCYFFPYPPIVGLIVFFLALYAPVIAEVFAEVQDNMNRDGKMMLL